MHSVDYQQGHKEFTKQRVYEARKLPSRFLIKAKTPRHAPGVASAYALAGRAQTKERLYGALLVWFDPTPAKTGGAAARLFLGAKVHRDAVHVAPRSLNSYLKVTSRILSERFRPGEFRWR